MGIETGFGERAHSKFQGLFLFSFFFFPFFFRFLSFFLFIGLKGRHVHTFLFFLSPVICATGLCRPMAASVTGLLVGWFLKCSATSRKVSPKFTLHLLHLSPCSKKAGLMINV